MLAKELRAQARQMRKMAETMELMDLAKSDDPQAVQKFLTLKLTRQLQNKARAQVRKAVNKSLGL
jgi:hypothetical protein